MALSAADLEERLSIAFCTGNTSSVGAAFVTAFVNALDRDSDGVLSCAEYEMLDDRCQFQTAGQWEAAVGPFLRARALGVSREGGAGA